MMERRDFLKGLFSGIAASYAAANIPVIQEVKSEIESDFNILDKHGEPLVNQIIDKPINYIRMGDWVVLSNFNQMNIESAKDQLMERYYPIVKSRFKGYGYDIVSDNYLIKEPLMPGEANDSDPLRQRLFWQKGTVALIVQTNMPSEIYNDVMSKEDSVFGKKYRDDQEDRKKYLPRNLA